ncbi:ATP-dependent DNA helicase [Trichonephila clavipes]|nr:ATP-dependent DNA helicase [Trichonephila clavipes]
MVFSGIVVTLLDGGQTAHSVFMPPLDIHKKPDAEILNYLDISGTLPHNLPLKIGSLIILLRNLIPPRMYNCTLSVIKRITGKLLEAKILSIKFKGEIVLLSRIPLISGKKAAKAHKEICRIYGVVADYQNSQIRMCLKSFVLEIFRTHEDDQRSGRSSEMDDYKTKDIIAVKRYIVEQDIAKG